MTTTVGLVGKFLELPPDSGILLLMYLAFKAQTGYQHFRLDLAKQDAEVDALTGDCSTWTACVQQLGVSREGLFIEEFVGLAFFSLALSPIFASSVLSTGVWALLHAISWRLDVIGDRCMMKRLRALYPAIRLFDRFTGLVAPVVVVLGGKV